MTEQEAETYLRAENHRYRDGDPALTDIQYDTEMAYYAVLYPDNAWFNQREVEPEFTGKTVPLPARMLSTDKAYSHKEIEKWVDKVMGVGNDLGIPNIFFRVTPKLDGYAAYDDGKILYTRGDGRSGTDITRAIDRGLRIDEDARGQGAGEIVVDRGYFVTELASFFENSRNIIAGVIKEGELDPVIQSAISAGAVVFQPFSALRGWTRERDDLLADLEMIWDDNAQNCCFDTDGLVIEATHWKIIEAMGATNHHHRWQIAYKKNTEYHDIKVTGLVWQTSKNGRLTPVVQLEPTKVSGVTISKATGHNYGNIVDKGIDTGAVVRVCRSGLVIPYIESVVSKVDAIKLPYFCPSCDSVTEIVGDNLLCTNTETCPAQIEGTIEFFFKTLGNCDGFGPKVIEKFCAARVDTVAKIYSEGVKVIISSISCKVTDNLFRELEASRRRHIEDWRFLAAFSIHNVGKGGCEKLLKHHRLADVFNLTADEIMAIDGFAQKSADSLVKSLRNIKPQFDALMKLGFNLVETPIGASVVGNLSGKIVVFTGTLKKGRSEMESQAKALGAKVGSSVSSKTDYLIIGTNVGAAKTAAAEKHGVTVLTEEQYLELLKWNI
jgi:DNA ligase (NAD+)